MENTTEKLDPLLEAKRFLAQIESEQTPFAKLEQQRANRLTAPINIDAIATKIRQAMSAYVIFQVASPLVLVKLLHFLDVDKDGAFFCTSKRQHCRTIAKYKNVKERQLIKKASDSNYSVTRLQFNKLEYIIAKTGEPEIIALWEKFKARECLHFNEAQNPKYFKV